MVVSSSSPSTPAPIGLLQTPFTLAARKMPSNQVEQCHRAVTKFVVKGLHPFATVETPWFREMTKALNTRYSPCRTVLSNTLIPAWYEVEKQNVITELANVSKVAITSDGWTSLAQDHYITVTQLQQPRQASPKSPPDQSCLQSADWGKQWQWRFRRCWKSLALLTRWLS